MKFVAGQLSCLLCFGVCTLGAAFRQADAQVTPASTPPAFTASVTPGEKAKLYLKNTFQPGEIFGAALFSAFQMATPPRTYPPEWRQGAQAFGRNAGDGAARDTAASTGQFVAALLTREDPRYWPSSQPGVLRRTGHALLFTFVDRADTGKSRLAYANFAGAVAGGVAPTAFLPDGFGDSTHFGQRSLLVFAGIGLGNLGSEYRPELKHLGHRLHLPFVPR